MARTAKQLPDVLDASDVAPFNPEADPRLTLAPPGTTFVGTWAPGEDDQASARVGPRLTPIPPPPAATADLQPAVDRLARLLTQAVMAEVDVDAIAGRGAALKARLDALQTIEDRSSLESACLVGLDAKALAAEVSGSVLDELKGLAYALHKELSGLCSELTTPAKDAETAIKIGIEQFCSAEMREHYLRELEAQGVTYQRAVADRERELKALRAAGRGADADAIERMPIHNPYIPKPYAAAPVPGVSISVTGHQCVVVDASLLPADLLKSVPDQDLIGARAAATGFAKPIPGVEFVPLYRIAFTRRK